MKLRDFPYLYITWLSPLLAGERSCEWAVWFKAHYSDFAKVECGFDFAQWRRQHTALLNDTVERLKDTGQSVYIEEQNKFTWEGQVATLGGKADIVSVAPDLGRATVHDTKSGRPKDSDMLQVQLYMWALPRAVERYKGLIFDGRVVYSDDEILIPANTITDDWRRDVKALILRLAADHPARKVPAPNECRWCDITLGDCPERLDTPERVAITDDF